MRTEGGGVQAREITQRDYLPGIPDFGGGGEVHTTKFKSSSYKNQMQNA